jgi:protein TonB
VFEQSVLIAHSTNKRWSVLVSLSGELVLLYLLILIPLIYTDQLPHFVRQLDMLSSPPPQPLKVDVQQVAGQASSKLRILRIFTDTLVRRVPFPRLDAAPIIDEPPGVPGATGVAGAGPLTTVAQLPAQTMTAPPEPKPAETKAPVAPIRVSVGVQMARLVKRVIPVYPPMAKAMRISGVVHLTGVIGKDGRIERLQLISGHPMLAQAALEAVREWIYKPTLLNGEPVEVIAPIDVTFTLTQ